MSTDPAAAPRDPAAFSAMLGPRCASTVFVAASPAEVSGAAGLPLPPVVSCGTDAAGDPRVTVADLRAARASSVAGGLVAADVSAIGPYTCPAVMRGADVVCCDLAAFVCPGLVAPLAAVSLSRDAAARPGLCRALSRLPGAALPATAAAALANLPAHSRRTSDSAAALAAYLECHPAVAAASYPGLRDDPAHDVAARTLEHGFGPLVCLTLAGGPGARSACLAAAATLAPACEERSPTALAPAGGDALRLTVGDGDPLALVMWLEAVLGDGGGF